MLVCLLMISSLMIVGLNKAESPDVSDYYFLNDYLLKQSEAIAGHCAIAFEEGIVFNSMGHINMARTMRFNKRCYTLNLGSGYVLVK